MKRILLLSASFGEGHNAAARNLKEALELRGGKDVQVRLEDPFLSAYGWVNRLTQAAYLGAINHTPNLWQWVFDLLHDTDILKQQFRIFAKPRKGLRKLLDDFKPDWILTTYPGCGYLLDSVQKESPLPSIRHATIVTDSISINSVWHRYSSNYYFVPNEDTAEILRQRRIPEEKIKVFGFPVPVAFSELKTERSYPPATGDWRVLYVIHSAQHLACALVDRLLEVPGVRLTATYGRDEALGDALRKHAKDKNKSLELHGWTPEMPRLMAENHVIISKAGGATVQECLAASTPMIVSQIVPGQEVGNAILLERYKAGVVAETSERIVEALHSALADGGKLLGTWHAGAARLSRPKASLEIADFILHS